MKLLHKEKKKILMLENFGIRWVRMYAYKLMNWLVNENVGRVDLTHLFSNKSKISDYR